jgi:hypothetical protein
MWPNRDPIEEIGGINLYEFVRNSPVGLVDHRGLNACTDGCLNTMNNTLMSGLPTAIGGGLLGGNDFWASDADRWPEAVLLSWRPNTIRQKSWSRSGGWHRAWDTYIGN